MHDQEHKLGAKWKTQYNEKNGISAGLTTTTSLVGVDLGHKTKLTENLSIKVFAKNKKIDWW